MKPGLDADLARLHARAFDRPWKAAEFAELLASPGVFARTAPEPDPMGFVLTRIVADEAEVLTLAVAPSARRQGLARALMAEALTMAAAAGARSVFLEVETGNTAAVNLYTRLGFEQAGLRRGYYDQGRADALVMRLDLAALNH